MPHDFRKRALENACQIAEFHTQCPAGIREHFRDIEMVPNKINSEVFIPPSLFEIVFQFVDRTRTIAVLRKFEGVDCVVTLL